VPWPRCGCSTTPPGMRGGTANNHCCSGSTPRSYGAVSTSSNFSAPISCHGSPNWIPRAQRRGASGLANRQGFVEHELLSDEQANLFATAALTTRLQAMVPATVEVSTSDNKVMQIHPDSVASGKVFRAMAVEPDGAVRAMCIYEGVVGNILTEEPYSLWERARSRWTDPFVVEALAPVRTMREWAEAARRIDYHFGTDDDRARIDRRPDFLTAFSE